MCLKKEEGINSGILWYRVKLLADAVENFIPREIHERNCDIFYLRQSTVLDFRAEQHFIVENSTGGYSASEMLKVIQMLVVCKITMLLVVMW